MAKKKASEETEAVEQPFEEVDPEEEAAADPTTQIYVDPNGSGHFHLVTAPLDAAGKPQLRARRLLLNGVSVEHVTEIDGIWAYRWME